MAVKRVLHEAPNQRRERLKTERSRFVKLMDRDDSLLRELSNDPIFEVRKSSHGENYLFFGLPGKSSLCKVRVKTNTIGDKILMSIGAIQGFKSGAEKAHENFRKEHGKPYYVFVAQSLIDAAYRAGFDRVGMTDIRHVYDYFTAMGKSKAAVELIRQRMRSQQGEIIKECGLQKKGNDYVLEFP